jgi:hypothetical protein
VPRTVAERRSGDHTEQAERDAARDRSLLFSLIVNDLLVSPYTDAVLRH